MCVCALVRAIECVCVCLCKCVFYGQNIVCLALTYLSV